MRMMQQAKNSFGGTDIWKTNEWILGLVVLLTSALTMSIVPFTRKDFGERYLGWLNLYFGYSAMATFITFSSLMGGLLKIGTSPQLMHYFWLAFVGMTLYHRYEISRKNRKGIEWHSMYIGKSLLPLPFSQETILKFFEPLSVFLLGFIVMKFSGQMGLWLIICAIAVAINNQIVFFQERQSVLDMRDAQIEAKYISDAFAGKPASQTAGFTVSESCVKLMATDTKLADAFSNLSDDMKDILDSPSYPSKPHAA